MTNIWVILLLLIILCFLVFQWWFEQSRVRNMSDVRRNARKWYQRPLLWALCSGLVFIIVLILISRQIYYLAQALKALDY